MKEMICLKCRRKIHATDSIQNPYYVIFSGYCGRCDIDYDLHVRANEKRHV